MEGFETRVIENTSTPPSESVAALEARLEAARAAEAQRVAAESERQRIAREKKERANATLRAQVDDLTRQLAEAVALDAEPRPCFDDRRRARSFLHGGASTVLVGVREAKLSRLAGLAFQADRIATSVNTTDHPRDLVEAVDALEVSAFHELRAHVERVADPIGAHEREELAALAYGAAVVAVEGV